jgi:sugar phosphate isomerase/epimerase
LDEALACIAETGCEYVEVEGNLRWCNHADPWKDDPVKFRDKVRSYGFKGVSALGSHRELITEQRGAEDIKRALEWAAAAEIPIVVTGEGRQPEGMSEQEALDNLRPRIADILATAEKVKVRLAIEPHGSISLTPGGLSKILSPHPSQWLGVNFDTGNPHRGDYVGTNREQFGWKLDESKRGNEIEVLKPIADRVVNVHIKDVIGRSAVTLGKGEVNLRECLRLLKKAGFDGVLSYQTEGWEDAEETKQMIRDSRTFLERALREV